MRNVGVCNSPKTSQGRLALLKLYKIITQYIIGNENVH